MVYKKPPLGIMPRYLWEELRIKELVMAIKRYEKEDVPIPNEWLIELKDLITRRKEWAESEE